MTFRMEKGQRRKRNFRKLFHGTVGRLKPRGMLTLDMYSAAKSVFIEKGTKLKLNVALQPIIRLNVIFYAGRDFLTLRAGRSKGLCSQGKIFYEACGQPDYSAAVTSYKFDSTSQTIIIPFFFSRLSFFTFFRRQVCGSCSTSASVIFSRNENFCILRRRKPLETSRGRRAVGRGWGGGLFLRQTRLFFKILHRFVYRLFPRQHHRSCDSDRGERHPRFTCIIF